jgi:hypothetical protein
MAKTSRPNRPHFYTHRRWVLRPLGGAPRHYISRTPVRVDTPARPARPLQREGALSELSFYCYICYTYNL